MHEQHDENQLHLPDELVRELKARDVSQPFVPAAVDEAVLARAREQFAAARADNQHDRGEAAVAVEAASASGEGHPGRLGYPGMPGAEGKRKAVFWGRAALAGVGSVAAALALAALLATDPTSSPSMHQADSIRPEANQMLALSEAPAAPPEVSRKLEGTMPAPTAAPTTVAADSEQRADANATQEGQAATQSFYATPGWKQQDGDEAPADDAMPAVEEGKLAASGQAAKRDTRDASESGFGLSKALTAAHHDRSAEPAKEMPATAARPAESADAAMSDAAPAQHDIDRSGRVDILDVYLLARRREAGDAAITQAAIDAIAAQVVRLARSEGGSL